jgi:nicotinamidase-related amidase
MPIPRLRPEDTVLLVVDIQSRFAASIHGWDALVANSAIVCRAAGELGVPVIVTEQNPRGLGHTVPEIVAALPAGTPTFTKTRFSSITPEVHAALAKLHRGSVLVVGIEAHVCVMQTTLDLLAGGRQPFLCTDCVSAGQASQVEPALRRMERAGAVPTGALSCIYEMLGDAAHPKFKACLEMVKGLRTS